LSDKSETNIASILEYGLRDFQRLLQKASFLECGCDSGQAIGDVRILLLICGVTFIGSANAQFIQSQLEFDVPIDSHRVLKDSEGGNVWIALTGRSATSQKYLGLYPVREESVDPDAVIEVLLPPEILFFDAGRVGEEMKLLFLSPRGVSELDPESGTIHRILDISSIYRSPSKARVTELDFLMDVNQDGREDIVLPDFEGLRIAFQTDSGFEAGELLDIQPDSRFAGGEARYLVNTMHHFDFTLDGQKDLAIIEDNHILVFEGSAAGFARKGRSMPIDIELADEGRERYEDRVVEIDQSDYRLSRIDQVVDLNGDELPDILTITAISSGLFNKRTEYRAHLGRHGADGVSYLPEPDGDIPSDGIQVDLSTLDSANGKDLVSTSFRIGFGEIISALFSRSIKVNVELFRIGEEPLYPPQADYRAKVKLRFNLSTGFVNVPAVRFGDFDGDGFTDLMLQQDTEGLEIRLGDGQDFKSGTLQYSTTLPRDGTLIKVADVNGDERQDVLVGFGRGDSDGMRNRLHVLLAHPTHEGSRK